MSIYPPEGLGGGWAKGNSFGVHVFFSSKFSTNPYSETEPDVGMIVMARVDRASGDRAALSIAEDVFAEAASRATAQNKSILMVFRASWCDFCRPLDNFLDAPDIRPIMDKYFVRVDLAVDEEAQGKPYLNNPGAEDFWIRAGGRGHVPFMVIYDSQGEPIVTSNRQPIGGNMGYPAKPVEVDWFVQMLKMSAASISDAELKTIHAWLTARGHN